MPRFSALETQTSVGVQTNVATRLLVHIDGVNQNALLKVTCDKFNMNSSVRKVVVLPIESQ